MAQPGRGNGRELHRLRRIHAGDAFLPLYFRLLGVTDLGAIAVWSGLSLGVTPAVAAFMTPVWGRLADRFGRKPMVVRALISFIVVMTGLAFVTAPWQVLALRIVHGTFAGYGALTLAMAAESAPRERLARAIGLVQMAQRLGPAVGPVIGGLLAGAVGLRRAFLVAAAVYVVALLVVLLLYRERSGVESATRTADAGRSLRAIVRFDGMVLAMAVIFVVQYAERSFGPVLPLFVAALGVPIGRVPVWSGVLFSLVAGAGALGNHACGNLLQRWSPRAVILGSVILAGGSAALASAATDVALLVIALPVFGLAVGTGMTAAYTTAGRGMPAGAQGAGFGVLSSAAMAGLALSPVLSGLLGSVSLRAVFVVNAVLLGALGIGVGRSRAAARPAVTGEGRVG